MSETTTAARGRYQPVLFEEAARRAHGQPLPFRMMSGQKGQELFGTPGWMMAACLEQSSDNVSWRAGGAMERPAGSFAESGHSMLFEPIDPFVAGLAADAVAAAHFSYRIESSGAVGNEQEFLVHG